MSALRPDPSRATGGVALALAALLLPASSPAQQAGGPEQRLQRIERDIGETRERRSALEREAGELEEEITSLRHRSVTLAAREQRLEGKITTLERRSAALAEKEAEISASLGRRRTQLTGMLAALQRIAHHPPAALIALPASAVDTLRSAMLLRAAVPGIEARAGALRVELRELAAVRGRITRTRTDLARATVGLDAERDRLETLLQQRSRLAARTQAARRETESRMTRLAHEARTVQELMDRLAEERRRVNRLTHERIVRLTPPRRAAPAEAPRTPLPVSVPVPVPRDDAAIPRPGELPVRGRIIRTFGQEDGIGGAAKGITIEARAAARVVAPESGEVVFAGPFQGLGQLLIIEHAKGYHTLLAGLARIDAEVGEKVLTGEPVGVLASPSQSRPALYVELRRRGRPIDPVPWLAAERTRVNG